jgi:autotransporter-associated beta strand protein
MIKKSPSPTSSAPTKLLILALGLAAIGSSLPAQGNTDIWDGATSGTWDTSTTNWSGSTFTSGDDALFTGTPVNNVTTASGLTIGSITLDSSFTGSVSLTGNNTVNGATAISSGTLAIQHISTATGTVTATELGSSAVTINSGGTLFVDDDGNGTTSADRILSIGNTISGAGILQARPSALYTGGSASVNFTGNLSGFTGTLNVLPGTTSNRGKVKFTAASQAAVMSSSATAFVQSGATLYLNQAFNYGFGIHLIGTGNAEGVGALRLEGNANVTGNVTLESNSTIGANASAATISGVIGETGGSFGFTKVGNNTLTLTGLNTYSGTTTVSAGTLQIGNGGTSGMIGSANVTNNAILTLNRSDDFVLTNNIANSTNGSGILTKLGAGKATLSGSSTFGNDISVSAGTLEISGTVNTNGASNSNVGFLSVAGNSTVSVVPGGALNILGTTNGTKPNSIVGQNAAGTSTLLVNGGSLTIGGNTGFDLGNNVNTATGVLTVSSGTATINAGSTTLQNTLNFVALGRDNATGIINLDGGVLASGRQFVRDGSAGNIVGSGTATFNFNGGTLKALASQTGGNGWFETATTGNFQVVTTNVKDNGAKIDTNGFDVNINTPLVHAGVASIDGGLNKSGAGKLTLGGVNTYTGTTVINAGTLALNASGSIDNTPSISVQSGATFDVSAKSSFAIGLSQSLTGAGTVQGSLAVNGSISGSLTVAGTLTAAAGSTTSPSANNTLPIANLTANSFNLNSGAHLALQINGVSDGDKITTLSNNGLTLDGDATFSFASSYIPTASDSLSLIVNGGTGAVQGAGLSAVTIVDNSGSHSYSGAEGTQLSINGQLFDLTYVGTADATAGNDLILQAVPEPSTWVMLLGGVGMLGCFQKRRRTPRAS